MRRHFHIQPFNIFGWQPPAPGTGFNVRMKHVYHFMLGYGPLNGSADQFLTIYDKFDPGPNGPDADGKPTRKGFIISGGPGRKGLDLYKVVFYPTPWHTPKLSKHPNARLAYGVNTRIFAPTPPPRYVHPVPCPGLTDAKYFCNDGGYADPDARRLWHDYDYAVVAQFAPSSRLHLLMDKPGRRIVVGYIDPECEECNNIADELADADIEVAMPLEAEEMAELYRHAKVVYFPQQPDGGGEMALLEARAVGAKIEVESDNPRLQSLLAAPHKDHMQLALTLTEGLWSALKR